MVQVAMRQQSCRNTNWEGRRAREKRPDKNTFLSLFSLVPYKQGKPRPNQMPEHPHGRSMASTIIVSQVVLKDLEDLIRPERKSVTEIR
jgi:hypothetical protein